jgi:hypothetical protein
MQVRGNAAEAAKMYNASLRVLEKTSAKRLKETRAAANRHSHNHSHTSAHHKTSLCDRGRRGRVCPCKQISVHSMFSGTLSACCIRTSLSRAQGYCDHADGAHVPPKGRGRTSMHGSSNTPHEKASQERSTGGVAGSTPSFIPLLPDDMNSTLDRAGGAKNLSARWDHGEEAQYEHTASRWALVQEEGQGECMGACAVLKARKVSDLIEKDEG